MTEWIPLLLDKLAEGRPVVRMAVATVRGSAPREPGATLLYWRDEAGRTAFAGTIGGGRLEARALEIASHLLDAAGEARHVERFSLGASLGQCCGGVVELYWERFDTPAQAHALAAADRRPASGLLRYCAMDGSGRSWVLAPGEVVRAGLPPSVFPGKAALLRQGEGRFFVERLEDDTTPLWIYGAGHVGSALVRVLAGLPFAVTWVDSREDLLLDAAAGLGRPEVTALWDEDPAEPAATAPADAWHLVMTHSHDQDLRICEALLKAGGFGFLGLIGSRSKAARFRHRLSQRGCAPEALARMVCPIGVAGIEAKAPAAIAIAVAAQLLQQREGAAARSWPSTHSRSA